MAELTVREALALINEQKGGSGEPQATVTKGLDAIIITDGGNSDGLTSVRERLVKIQELEKKGTNN